MPLADTVIAQWGAFGVILVALATVAIYLEKARRAAEKEASDLRAKLGEQATAHAAATSTLDAAHRAELERQRRDFETRADAQRAAHQTERAEWTRKLDEEHRARLEDSKATTQQIIQFTDRMHQAVTQMRELADRIANLPPR